MFIINALSIVIQRGPLKESIGPHNTILYIWFSAAYWVCDWSVIRRYHQETASSTFRKVEISPTMLIFLLFLSLCGFTIVRGNFEQVDIAQIGIVLVFCWR